MLTPINHVDPPLSRSDIMANESSNQRGGSGNFADDPERASEAGRKGGQQSHQGSGQSEKSQQGGSDSSGQQRGGSGNFANDPERASEAGRKGGEHSKGGQ
jgi:general stress protein YciG